MTTKDFPKQLEFLGWGHNVNGLTMILREVFGHRPQHFSHMTTIKYLPCSGRALSSQPLPDSVAFPKQLTAHQIAKELVKLSGEARYAETKEARDARLRGWKIWKGMQNGKIVVIVLAKYVLTSDFDNVALFDIARG